MYEIVYLDHGNSSLFYSLLLPGHIQKLQGLGQQIYGLGLLFENKRIGIALIELDVLQNRAHIFHFLIKSVENQLLATESLVKRVEELLDSKGYYPSVLDLQQDKVQPEIVECFRQRGWKGPLQQASTYICDSQLMLRAPWMIHLKDIEFLNILPWTSISENQLTALASGVDDWYPKKFSPLYDREYVDNGTSFILSYQGDIHGWVISEKVASNMIVVRTFFVRNKGKARFGTMLLMAEVIKRAANNNWYIMFLVEKDNLDMNTIVSKRLMAGVIKESVTVQFSKS